MKKQDVKIGSLYRAKVSNSLATVKILRENTFGGWDAMNEATGREIRIKSAQRLRCEVTKKVELIKPAAGQTGNVLKVTTTPVVHEPKPATGFPCKPCGNGRGFFAGKFQHDMSCPDRDVTILESGANPALGTPFICIGCKALYLVTKDTPFGVETCEDCRRKNGTPVVDQSARLAKMHADARREKIVAAYKIVRALTADEDAIVKKLLKTDPDSLEQHHSIVESFIEQYQGELLAAYREREGSKTSVTS